MLIGRENEIEILKRSYESNEPEFIALYGRRRVGKTFLVRQLFRDNMTFYLTGIYKGSLKEQLDNFSMQMEAYFGIEPPKLKSWFEAFSLLRKCLEKLPEGRKLIFLDELPWMETQRSRFVKALELFWNGWASGRNDIMMIVCGSATSWMDKKVIHAKGGLHNRLTQRIHLKPFKLRETREYLLSKGMEWSDYEIAECYMALGGIPYYLSKLLPNLSMTQNIDNLFFSASPVLEDEFKMLYEALFSSPESYIRVVEHLGHSGEGETRDALSGSLKMKDGGSLSKILEELEISGIVTSFPTFGMKKKKSIYKLTDFYTSFYLHFIKNNKSRDYRYWTNMIDNPIRRRWEGLAFERVCQYHSDEIKQKMGILGVSSEISTWRSQDHHNYQIDMVIDRRDNNISLCEMKFSLNTYSITAADEQRMRERMAIFSERLKKKKTLSWTFVTTYGITRNSHASLVRNEVLLSDLFHPVR